MTYVLAFFSTHRHTHTQVEEEEEARQKAVTKSFVSVSCQGTHMLLGDTKGEAETHTELRGAR